MQNIQTIDLLICCSYLLFVVGLGLFFSNKQKNNDDFFLGGRNMHWLPVGLSLFATTFSSNSFVGLPAEGAFDRFAGCPHRGVGSIGRTGDAPTADS